MQAKERTLEKMKGLGHSYDATPISEEAWQEELKNKPALPTNSEDLIRHIEMLHGAEPHNEHCGKSIAKRISVGLTNPALSDAHIKTIDQHFHATLDPLPDSVESTYFYVAYDTTGTGAVTAVVAQATADVLDQHYLLFKGLFAKAPYQSSTTNGKQTVEIRKLNGTDGYSTRSTPIMLNSASMNNQHNRPWTTAHELFHCLQYAFGLDAAGYDDPLWFVEGSANWAATFAEHGVVDGAWSDFTQYQDHSIFSESYDAFPLWIFLNGFRSVEIDHQSTAWDVQTFLNTYETSKNSFTALDEVLNVAMHDTPVSTAVPNLIARYTAAKAVNEWRGPGRAYSRQGIMPYMATLENYSTGAADPPPAIPYTGTGTLTAVNTPVPFNDKTLVAGAANLYKLTFTSGQFQDKWAYLTITKALGQSAVTACMLPASDLVGHKGSHQLVVDSATASKTVKLHLTQADTNSIYIAVVDGRLGGATAGNIDYSVKIKIRES